MIDPAVSSTRGSGTVDVHLIPTRRDDEVDHMPGTRMHLRGLAFILLLEHGVRSRDVGSSIHQPPLMLPE